ncbi:hypothetical protein M514_02669 [Trichuris suis]|uniref:Uncharacterized protein n=1 Tax=Trichuris suis TaxID=68888 RepID=A0A085NNP5_9BILA|nr:hypothetical protein M513_02669 [Trichuris suis]KFD71091.1 hypothetical protein M514_02669 [Trichuris suis]
MAALSGGSCSDDDFDVLPEDEDISTLEELNHQFVGSMDSPLMNSILGLKCSAADASAKDGRMPSTSPPVDCELDLPTAEPTIPDGAESVDSSFSIPSSNVSVSVANAAVKNPAALQLRHVERQLSDFELMMEALKTENAALNLENQNHRAGLSSFAEVVSSLQRQVEELLKENNELKEACASYERRERLREETLDQLKQDLAKLQSLNVALQMQVMNANSFALRKKKFKRSFACQIEEDESHVIALKDRHQIEIELLTNRALSREENTDQLNNNVEAASHSSIGYQCEGCCDTFSDEESLIIHLHCCSRFQQPH